MVKINMKQRLDNFRTGVKTDDNLIRANKVTRRGFRALPSATLEYFVEKVPFIGWLPKYNLRWLIQDFIAGLTVGVLLIPQSLAYATIATIPGEYGLMSSWIPGILYFIMGTSKDLSTGPTSLIGLLTAEIVRDLQEEGYRPEQISSAVAMFMGLYGLALGLFKLGFILNFISVPVLTGFISAAAIVIMLGQVPALFGGMTIGSGTGTVIHDILWQLGRSQGPTVGVGFGGIFLLIVLQKIGDKYGKKNKIIWYINIGRSAICLLLFTGISYGVNKSRRDDPVWAISRVQSRGIEAPVLPPTSLITKIPGRAIAPFVAAALEHLAIAKGFGRKNDYVIDQSQELVYFGLANFLNSFFSVMGVGGAMSRTAVNSASGVRSPLSHLIAAGFVLLSIYKLSPALYWIPKATLAAIIITAVYKLVGPLSAFVHFWQTSLSDFIASMLAFWISLFVSTEIGIAVGVGWSVAYHLVRSAFSSVKVHSSDKDLLPTSRLSSDAKIHIDPDTRIFRFKEAIMFFNAEWVKDKVIGSIQTYNSGDPEVIAAQQKDRNWSVSGQRRIRKSRQKAGVEGDPPQVRIVILDMTNVTYMDQTALVAFGDLKAELEKYAGKSCELRFAAMNKSLRSRFARARWPLVDQHELSGPAPKGTDVCYRNVEDAVDGLFLPKEYEVMDGEKVPMSPIGHDSDSVEKIETKQS